MTTVPEAVDMFMYDVLAGVCRLVLSPDVDPIEYPIKRHVWRNSDYVGINPDGKVSFWKGWSINLSNWGYGTLYIDFAHNDLDIVSRQRLFGNLFSICIQSFRAFVVLYAARFKHEHAQIVQEYGFIYRTVGDALHVGLVAECTFIYQGLLAEWIDASAQLLRLQRQLLMSPK